MSFLNYSHPTGLSRSWHFHLDRSIALVIRKSKTNFFGKRNLTVSNTMQNITKALDANGKPIEVDIFNYTNGLA